MDAMQHSLLLHAVILMFIWAPFAVAAFFVEDLDRDRARRWRGHLVHPIRDIRHARLTHGAPAH